MAHLGHRAITPPVALDADVERPGEAFVREVAAALHREGACDGAVVVGHSGAGLLLPELVDRLEFAPSGIVLVDSAFPRDGWRAIDHWPLERVRALLLNTDEAGMVRPWSSGDLAESIPNRATREAFVSRLAPVPDRYFREERLTPGTWPSAPCAYLLLSRERADAAESARAEGWIVRRPLLGHFAPLAAPCEVADELEALGVLLRGAVSR